jgi:hypothetical protein
VVSTKKARQFVAAALRSHRWQQEPDETLLSY